MAKFLLFCSLLFSLAGCAQLNNDWLHSLFTEGNRPASYDFSWQISGDDSVAPLQVFDDGSKLWLQYPAGSDIPAFFSRTVQGDILLSPKRSGEYLVLNQVPAKVIVRGGLFSAVLTKLANNNNAANDSVSLQPVANVDVKPLDTAAKPVHHTAISQDTDTATINNPATKPVAASAKSPTISKTNTKTANNKPQFNALLSSSLSKVKPEFSVNPGDINIRKALQLWSKRSAWTFTDEHWAVDVDIPIAGSASFGDDFEVAVRNLLAATELGDRPLQPCFYANKVLRVVPYAQRCDRTVAVGVEL